MAQLKTEPLINRRDYSLRENDRMSLLEYAKADIPWKYLNYTLLNPNGIIDDEIPEIAQEVIKARCLNPQLRV